jgi:hypothetical protein
MILPRGKCLYENLRTSFIDFNNFLQALKEDNLTGYVQVSSWDYEGVLFLEAGEIVNALEERNGNRRAGEEAVDSIMNAARQKDGKIDCYELAPEMVTILASTSDEEAVYRNLTTEFTSLKKLMQKLGSEGHSGYVEIVLNNRGGEGIIFFQEGEIVEAVMSGAGGESLYGRDMLTQIVGDAERVGATFNVYRAGVLGGSPSRVEVQPTRDMGSIIEVMQEVLRRIEGLVDGLTSRKGSFVEGFKRAQVEKSERYPFLDPFLAEFEYGDGEIKLWGQTSADEFVQGVNECLVLTLEKMPVKIARDELYARISSTIHPVVDRYQEMVESYGIKAAMPAFFGM